MSNFYKPRRAAQRGDILLESLIGVLLTGILGAGIAHVSSRISVGQHDAKLENIVVERLRDRLQRDGLTLCDAPALPIALTQEVKAAISVDCKRMEDAEVGVAGALKTVPVPREITLQASAVGSAAIELGTHQLPEETR
ncbi:MAG: hypothetical protein WAZ48_08285 [Lysobacteraceae bacterium]